MNNTPDSLIKKELNRQLEQLENHFKADFLTYYGPIQGGLENVFLKLIEDLAADPNKRNRLCIMLTTGGGSAEVVERCVNIIRHHYEEVFFIVPDYAYSAGTIFCMSGDKIFMDYYSVLGPIDPQVLNKEGKWVAALGYLDKINELLQKAQNGTLTDAEFVVFKDFDLAEIKGYEQAKELTVSLLKKWLVQYKFRNWNEHRTTNPGTPVTKEQKTERAEEIAQILNQTSLWKTHGRPINLNTLKEIRLDIEDYGTPDEIEKSTLIRSYNQLFNSFVAQKFSTFVHTRKFI